MTKHFLAQIEEDLLRQWDEEETFVKSLDQTKDGKLFSFFDGPPFANGMPHFGHIVQTTIKDAITRYKTMQGFHVPRKVGWDTHGLPVEYAIEKEHNFKGKKDIIDYGIAKFNKECEASVYKYKELWEKMFTRVGRWADYQATYSTLDSDYMESVWWAFKTIYDKKLIYKDFRASPYCPRCATPLSNFELNLGYQDNVIDPSLFVKFKLSNEDAYLLGWTTTPWSLPGNAAIAVNEEADYVYVKLADDEQKQETLILARNRLSILDTNTYHIVKEVKGKDLIGLKYDPLFTLNYLESLDSHQNLFQVWGADFVSIDDGSGILHVAPAFGEDDLSLGKEKNIPILITIDEYGKIKSKIGLPPEIEELFFKKADPIIIEMLTKKNSVFAAENFKHTYPFCWRCDTPLLYYATDSWLIKVSALNEKLLKNNDQINWTPKHIKNGRFGKWLEGAKDWAISRNRFWGAPLPVWVTDDQEIIVIGSVAELKELAIDKSKVNNLHRPFIDDVEILTKSGKIAHRIPEVFDCWFESGSMPYAQSHYPFKDQDLFKQYFPADFIAEAIDQTRGWFYTMHVLGTALFDQPAYKNVICSGWITAADGEKLSKRKKNYAPMDDIFDQYGVDTLRFFMASSPIVNGEDVRFSTDFLRDVQRRVFMTLNNIYNFYKLYADVDHFQPPKDLTDVSSPNLLDQWVISRVNETIQIVTSYMDQYRLDKATQPIAILLDDISNWYVRRSRRRFWKSEDDNDKQNAYETLYYVLVRTCQVIAPFSPFLSDFIWRDITKNTSFKSSVHLSLWPKSTKIDYDLLEKMSQLREQINVGLGLRAENKIKVRQPLQSIVVPKLDLAFRDVIAEELNVKEVKWGSKIELDLKINLNLELEGLAREIIRHIQSLRKKIGLNVDDRIYLEIESDDLKIRQTVDKFKQLINQETLSEMLTKDHQNLQKINLSIDNHELSIAIKLKPKDEK
jgi:isoleucyl-tRNA synthetase